MFRFLAVILMGVPAAVAGAQTMVDLWPGGAPGSAGIAGKEVWVERGKRTVDRAVSSVHQPTLTVYLPGAESATGAAVVIAPGGGYSHLAIDKEGHDVAAWLAKIGANDSAAIERLYKDPPVSTEQVMHPEKFPLDGPRDYPHLIATPDVAAVLGDGWEHVEDNDVGELSTGILLTQLASNGKYMPTLLGVMDIQTQGVGIRGPAKTASEGWDGDRYTAWTEKGGSGVAVVWTSVWDAEKDATEFHDTYGTLLGKRVLGKDFKERPSPVRYTDPATGRVSGLDVVGTRVVAVIGAPADKADALFAAGREAAVTPDPRDPNDK